MKKLKKQKGISLISLVIIVLVIILGIIFIVKMMETPDGIGTVQEEQEKYNKTLQEKEKADEQYQDALENFKNQQINTHKNYQQIYNEYSQKLITSGPTSSIKEMAAILNEGVTKMAEYMYSASGTDGQYSTYQSWVNRLTEVYMSNCR